MLIDKAPIQPIGNIAPIPRAVMAHFSNIVGPTNIRFGSKNAPIAKLAHAKHIGAHDPVTAIGIHAHKPIVNIHGQQFTHQHGGPQRSLIG